MEYPLTVINGYREGFTGPHTVYIGRGGRGLEQSPLANPWVINPSQSRIEVLRRYKQWLWEQVQDPNSPQYRELMRIIQLNEEQPVKLACFCKPKPCHGDILVDFINWFLSDDSDCWRHREV